MDENTIVCRCSDISLKDLKELIASGYTHIEDIKRISRAGMGPCQGRTCAQHIHREIARTMGEDIKSVDTWTARPPVKPIKLKVIAKGGEDHD